ncbi:hypothetical protein EN873_41915 [bacterium M00.F.Ca.ET.230.01.1.1]|nr:hypothetical protein EN873_41915 [bacterium M00.F.Ca.ET.230.01.1.1]
MMVHPTVAIRPAPLIRVGAVAPIHLLPQGEKEERGAGVPQVPPDGDLLRRWRWTSLLPLWEKVAERSSVG